MLFKARIVIVEATFMALLPSLEAVKVGFNDWVEGARLVDGACILMALSDFPTSRLDNVGLLIGVQNSVGRVHFLLG